MSELDKPTTKEFQVYADGKRVKVISQYEYLLELAKKEQPTYKKQPKMIGWISDTCICIYKNGNTIFLPRKQLETILALCPMKEKE